MVFTERDVLLAYASVHAVFPKLPPILRQTQLRSITATCNGMDLLCVIPTSSGKTLIMLASALVNSYLRYGKLNGDVGTIIIFPLNGLITQMLTRGGEYGLMCYNLKRDSMQEGELNSWLKEITTPFFLFASAEIVFRKGYAESLMQLANVRHICVDECHVVVEWGLDKGREQAFRRMYSQISVLRCLSDNCPSLSLFSATLDNQIAGKLKAVTGLVPETTMEIVEPPYRHNIFVNVIHGKEDLTQLSFLLEELRTNSRTTTKTIIFVNQVEECRRLYYYFWRGLGSEKRTCKEGMQVLFAVFNGVSSEEDKAGILNKFSREDSKIRLLIATVSFGMGMDVPDIRRCIIYGAPLSNLDAIQKMGRAGRDGLPSEAMFFPFVTQFYRSMKGSFSITDEMCYKVQLLSKMYGCKNFKIAHSLHKPRCTQPVCNCTLCNCCSFCMKTCPCKTQIN